MELGSDRWPAVVIDRANENGVMPFNAGSVASSLQVGYYEAGNDIGAVKDANDAGFQGWTCGLYANDCAIAPTVG